MTKKKPTKAQITHGALHEKQAIDLLREKLNEHGQIVLPQVRNGTGHTYRCRTADALIVETWASRGIGFTGVEYKRSRGDWLAELKAPAKAEEIGKYCRYWVILAPAGLIDLAELPELWGLWEIHDNKHIKVTHRAPLKKKVVPPTVEFVCSILRSNREYDPAYHHDWQLRQKIEDEMKARFKDKLERVNNELAELKKSIFNFEQETGLRLNWDIENSIKVAPVLLNHMKYPEQIFGALDKAREKLVETIDDIDRIKGKTDD